MASLDNLVRKLVTLGTAGLIALSPYQSSAAPKYDLTPLPLPPLVILSRSFPITNLQTIPSNKTAIKNPKLLGTIDFNEDQENYSFEISWPESDNDPSLLIKWPGLADALRKDTPIIGFGNVEILNQGNAFTYNTPEKETKYIFLARDIQTTNVRALDISTKTHAVEYMYPGVSTSKTNPAFQLTPDIRITVENAPIFYVDKTPQPIIPANPFNHQYHVNTLANLKNTHKTALDDLIKKLVADGKPVDTIRKEIQTYLDKEKNNLKIKIPSLFDDPYEYTVYGLSVTAACARIDQHYPKLVELSILPQKEAIPAPGEKIEVPPAALPQIPEDPTAGCWTHGTYADEHALKTIGRYLIPVYSDPIAGCFIDKGTTGEAIAAYIGDTSYKGALIFGLGYLTYSLLKQPEPLPLQETMTLRDKPGPRQ